MKVVNRKNLKVINDICGQIQEMCHTDNMSVAYIVVTGESISHLHKKTEEIYFIIKGKGIINIDNKEKEVEKDDLIVIPKNKFHSIKKIGQDSLELIAITNPRYNPDDVIEKE